MLSPIQYRLLLLGKKRTVPFFITNSHKSVIAKTKTSPRDPPDKVPTSPSEWVVDTHRWILHWLWLITSGRRFVMDHKCSYWLSYPRDKSSDGGPADSGFVGHALSRGALLRGQHLGPISDMFPCDWTLKEVAPDNYFPIFGWFAPSRKQLKVNRTKFFDVVLITNNAGFVIVNSLLISNMWSSGIYLNFVVIKWFNDRNMRRNLPFDYKHYKQDDAGSGSGRVLISPTVNNFSSKIFPNNCLVRWDKW